MHSNVFFVSFLSFSSILFFYTHSCDKIENDKRLMRFNTLYFGNVA